MSKDATSRDIRSDHRPEDQEIRQLTAMSQRYSEELSKVTAEIKKVIVG
jgi:hypothetical protein